MIEKTTIDLEMVMLIITAIFILGLIVWSIWKEFTWHEDETT